MKRSGRCKKLDIKKMNRLRSFFSRFPFITAREVKQELAGFSNILVRRIQEVLQKNLKMPSRTAAKKPLLTAQMTWKRIKFCKKYLNWAPKLWENILFSDELTFRLVNSRGMKVRRPSRLNSYKQLFSIPAVKHSASVMVWGCFSGKNRQGGLYFLPKNQTMNKSVLENHLLPFMQIHGATFFLQDGVGYEQAEGDGERLYRAGLARQFP
jgi:hypothetical protein